MTQAGIPFQAGFNQRDPLRDGLCRSFLKRCIKILAISILIQMPLSEACSEWKVMEWQPFNVKTKLVLQPRKGKVIKRGKAVTGKSSKVRDVGTQRLPGARRIWSDVQSFYGSELPARVWGSYLRRAGISPVLVKGGMRAETLFWSDLFRETMTQDHLLISSPLVRVPATIKEEGGAHYIRVSFFNHDMKYLNRDAAERRAGRYSPWETLLSPSSGEPNQSLLEKMGRIFEPKVDLAIEF